MPAEYVIPTASAAAAVEAEHPDGGADHREQPTMSGRRTDAKPLVAAVAAERKKRPSFVREVAKHVADAVEGVAYAAKDSL